MAGKVTPPFHDDTQPLAKKKWLPIDTNNNDISVPLHWVRDISNIISTITVILIVWFLVYNAILTLELVHALSFDNYHVMYGVFYLTAIMFIQKIRSTLYSIYSLIHFLLSEFYVNINSQRVSVKLPFNHNDIQWDAIESIALKEQTDWLLFGLFRRDALIIEYYQEPQDEDDSGDRTLRLFNNQLGCNIGDLHNILCQYWRMYKRFSTETRPYYVRIK